MSPPTRHDRHVLLVTPGFAADEDDDSCIPPLQVMLRTLSAEHPELRITILAVNHPPHLYDYRWHGIQVIPLGGGNRPWPFRLAAIRRGLMAARRVHAEQPVDLVHGLWLGDAALLGYLAARRIDVPVTVTALGQDVRSSNRYLRLLPLGSMKLGAVSQRAASILETNTGRVIPTVLPWGLDESSNQTPPWQDRKLDILGVGSLTANKDFTTFIRVVHRLQSDGRRVRAHIIGAGTQRPAICEEIDNRGLSDTVELCGHQSRQAVLETMGTARILLHPSRFEGFGFVFLEALAHQMAVVSRPVGIAEEGPRWRLCADMGDMATACASLLDRPPDPGNATPYPLASSLAAWGELYGLVAER